MIVTADWVLPSAAGAIRDGAVLVAGGRFAAVGTAAELVAAHPDETVNAFPGSVVIPGLVNAHAHLSLTSAHDLIPPAPFAEWLPRIAQLTRALDAGDFARSAAWGALKCLLSGVTVVGDVTYGPEPLAVCGDLGVAGRFFWEVLGVPVDELGRYLDEREYPGEPGACDSIRLRCALSPHSAYTAGPELLEATWARSRASGTPMMVHVAESSDEARLMRDGTGPLAELAGRLAPSLTPPQTGTVRYLDSLGVLDGAIAVHCVHLDEGEPALLAEKAAGVVLCPRSNRYLANGDAPVGALRAAGARIALGSDSLASNEGIDLFAEAREVRRIDPSVTAAELLDMLTADGAAILGMGDRFGRVESGLQADLAIIETGPTDDPAEAVIEQGSAETVRAVMSGGVWRVLGGKPTAHTYAYERGNQVATAKAMRALGA